MQDAAVLLHGHLRGRHVGLAVHVLEMHRVTGVLGDILHMGRHQELGVARLGPVGVAQLDKFRQLPLGRGVLRVEPYVDLAVFLLGVPGAQAGALGDFLAVGDFLALALGAETPAVERAADGLAHDPAAHAQVCAQVRAESVLQYRYTAAGAIQHQFAVEGLHLLHLTHLQLVAAGNGKPPHGEGGCFIGLGLTRIDDGHDLLHLVVVCLSCLLQPDKARQTHILWPFQVQCKRLTGEQYLRICIQI